MMAHTNLGQDIDVDEDDLGPAMTARPEAGPVSHQTRSWHRLPRGRAVALVAQDHGATRLGDRTAGNGIR